MLFFGRCEGCPKLPRPSALPDEMQLSTVIRHPKNHSFIAFVFKVTTKLVARRCARYAIGAWCEARNWEGSHVFCEPLRTADAFLSFPDTDLEPSRPVHKPIQLSAMVLLMKCLEHPLQSRRQKFLLVRRQRSASLAFC